MKPEQHEPRAKEWDRKIKRERLNGGVWRKSKICIPLMCRTTVSTQARRSAVFLVSFPGAVWLKTAVVLKHVGTAVTGPNLSLYSQCVCCAREGGKKAFLLLSRERAMRHNYPICFQNAASFFFFFMLLRFLIRIFKEQIATKDWAGIVVRKRRTRACLCCVSEWFRYM